jgi:hypothetical protein
MEEDSLQQTSREKGPPTPEISPVSIGGARAVLAIVIVLGLALLMLILFQHFAT